MSSHESQPCIQPLKYTIHSSSHNIPPYTAHNIVHNEPSSIDSRWSTHCPLTTSTSVTSTTNNNNNATSFSYHHHHHTTISTHQHQQYQPIQKFIVLKLEHNNNNNDNNNNDDDGPCIVRTITFGKYHRLHPCNMKEFKVYGCSDPVLTNQSSFHCLLHSKLRNDTKSEVFPLRSSFKHAHYGTINIPVHYLKIEALSTWSPHNYPSIWHIALHGWVVSGDSDSSSDSDGDRQQLSSSSSSMIQHDTQKFNMVCTLDLI